MADRVIVALSGGVDSAVAAWLLKQQGYDVRAIFMRNWDDDSKYCTANQDFMAACRVADHLGLELGQINFVKEYRQRVFEHCLALFQRGLTPNPDILCNSQIKFGAFLDAVADQTDWIATGHYARIIRSGNNVSLHRAIDTTKDQSYFLHQLNQQQLARSLFPLGEWTKQAVRSKAKLIGLCNYNRPDSTGICFIGERPFAEFLQGFLPARPGEIVDEKEQVIGQHKGVHLYTLGQRKGLGIGGNSSSNGMPWYVVKKNTKKNQLVAVQGEDHPLLFSRGLVVTHPHWLQVICAKGVEEKEFSATVRHRQFPQPCFIRVVPLGTTNTALKIYFKKPQKAVTPGQFAVVYQGSECMVGGMIDETWADNACEVDCSDVSLRLSK